MKNPGDEVAEWLVKALVAVLVFCLIVTAAGVLWLFSMAVRTVARAVVPEDDSAGLGGSQDGNLRLVGSVVGAALALVGWCLLLLVTTVPLATSLVAIAIGAAGGAIVVLEGANPWRALSAGWMVDDWTDDRDVW